ncbi:Ran-binding protein 1 [Schistosoma bovis]|uniref:Ran-binding protein 1 n=2 Tax=Schistosoma bovis TaxID=6184 RepID=A0A430Q4G5_SCHBO|nr:Ran-binding protein 1 [Schistosoma bovis]
MRRDRTYKVCANHYLLKNMYLRPNCSSSRAFVWSTTADFADEVVKPELLGVRFANSTCTYSILFQRLSIVSRNISLRSLLQFNGT